ncbi:MAG: DUF4116 domain-containing protein [Clostridia bacterium]|nr:DUF4116 domain-containing protein [Clostridia bacterium]
MEFKMNVRQLNALIAEYPESDVAQRSKELTIIAVSRNPSLLSYAAEKLRADKDVVLAAVKSGGQTLRFADEKLKADKDVVLAAVTSFCQSYSFALPPASDDYDVAAAVARSGGESISLLPEKFLSDKSLALIAVSRNPRAVRFFSDEIRADKDVSLAVIRGDRTAIVYLGDEAFNDKDVFEATVRTVRGAVSANILNNDTPLGVLTAAVDKGVKINLAAQNFNLLTLDRDKFNALVECCDGSFSKKGELVRKYIDLDDKEIVGKLLKLKLITPQKALSELKYASEHGKLKVLPVLLAYTQGAGVSIRPETERDKLIRSLRRKSTVAVKSLEENISEYINDREVITLAAAIDGGILAYLNESELISDEELVRECLKNYIVKKSEQPILSGLTNLKISYENAKFACKKDGRNYFCLPDELKADKIIAGEAARLDAKVYDSLPDELKNDPYVISRRL